MPLTRVYHAQKPSFWQRQHANLACCREPNLIFALLTAQRIFAIKTRRTKPPAAISQDYLLGGCAFGASGILFIAEATATRKSCVLPRAKLVFCFSTAQRIFAIKTRRTKPPAAISQDYLLGGCAFGASGILFIAEATATRKSCVLPRAKLVFCFSTAHHCSNGITVKSIAPYVIPRSETTRESPK